MQLLGKAIESKIVIETGAAMLVLTLTILIGSRLHLFGPLAKHQRSVISFSAGLSAAYVLLYAIPELCESRHDFASTVGVNLLFEGKVIYFLALVGFLTFYGLEHLRRRPKEFSPSTSNPNYRLQISSFAVYIGMMSYLLVYNSTEKSLSIALYSIAIAFHFLALDHSLSREFGARYQRHGRYLLSGVCVVGWILGVFLPLPQYVLALLMAFVSGAVIMNSTILELPTEKEGRFFPFMAGGVIYGLILLPLG
ncbi:MAG: hypothetical protein IOC63_00805 [Methylobacterium sp.]|nr:hypothetical protein [Methylobacterium sp.]